MNKLLIYFIDNKYTKLYEQIVKRAQSEHRKKLKPLHDDYIYYEYHHIIPVSVDSTYSDFTKHPWNKVLLTAREHFLCHYLLCKMVSINSIQWHSLVRAFTFMYSGSHQQYRYYNSRLYERARKNIGIVMSTAQSGVKNSQYNTIWVSNIQTQTCIKIPKADLIAYTNKGYIKKRIINWDSFIKRKNQLDQHRIDKIQTRINRINGTIDQLSKERKQLTDKLASYLHNDNN